MIIGGETPFPAVEEDNKRIVIFSLCIAVPFIPTDKQNEAALASLVRVCKEGMKMDVISAQVTQMTEAQARKNFEAAELAEATEEATRHLKS